ncbi:MAG: GTP 3',8-cyclase MoaA [Corynebacterium sp.]|nr:GTP 3',8-cyclase MoaA [Corynebacterium sp.]
MRSQLPFPTLRVPEAPDAFFEQTATTVGGTWHLRDTFGRVARDLRVSLTDRCNLRCTYCMPAEGLEWIPREDTLTDDEVIRLITLAVTTLGIRQVRFTGGEPLLRRSLEEIIAAISGLTTDTGAPVATALTTNGLGLDKRATGLKAAGLNRINISLDTLNPTQYAELTRRDRHHDVLAGIQAAQAAGLEPIKINAVIMPGVNGDTIVPLAQYCLENGLQLRFIEQMPLGPKGKWTRDAMVTAKDIIGILASEFSMSPSTAPRGSAPAELWRVRWNGHDGHIGVIAAVTHPFCGDCDRTRLTTDGAIRSCLFSHEETSLRDIMRAGATDAELAMHWVHTMWRKKAGHGINDPRFVQPSRLMSAIGG